MYTAAYKRGKWISLLFLSLFVLSTDVAFLSLAEAYPPPQDPGQTPTSQPSSPSPSPSALPAASATRPALPSPAPQGRVFLGLHRLHQLFHTPTPPPSPTFLGGEAAIQGSLKKTRLRLDLALRLRSTAKQPVWFSLGGRGGVIHKLRLNDKDTSPEIRPEGTYWLLLPPGDSVIQYRYILPLPKARGEHSLALDLPEISRSRLHLRLPGHGWAVRTEPASRVELKETGQEMLASLILPTARPLRLFWQGRRIERDEQTRWRVQSETLVTMREGLMLGTSRLSLQILTGALRQFEIKLPRETEILNVGGKGVTEWFQSRTEGDSQILQVLLGYPVRDRLNVEIRFERTKLPTGKPISLPSLHLPQAEQVTGIVGVLAEADTEVSHHQAKGAEPIDVRELPPHVRQRTELPILLGYRFEEPTWELSVLVVKHPPLKVISIIVNRATFETVFTHDGREVVKSTYWVTNNQRQFMPLLLPKGSTILGAFVGSQPVQPARAASKDSAFERYLLPLIRSQNKGTQKEFSVEILSARTSPPLGSWGILESRLPKTPLRILSFEWSFYMPQKARPIWLGGSVKPSWQQRFLRYLERRMLDDLRDGTPALWAGGGWSSTKINRYNKMGLKQRFASPAATAPRPSPGAGGRASSFDYAAPETADSYQSRFAQTRWQVRAEIPLVGRLLPLRGHLLHGTSPSLRVWYLDAEISVLWFWFVLLSCAALMLFFLKGLFAPSGFRWERLILALLGWGVLFVLGLLLPMTYLAGLRGALFGLWIAILLRLAYLDRYQFRFPLLVSWMRWWALFLTAILLFSNSISTQIWVLILAVPVYPSLLIQRSSPLPATTAFLVLLLSGGLAGSWPTSAHARPPSLHPYVPQQTQANQRDNPLNQGFSPSQAQTPQAYPAHGLGLLNALASTSSSEVSSPTTVGTTEGAWLPVSTYHAWVKHAQRPQVPRSARIGEAKYHASQATSGLIVYAQMTLETQGDGWHILPILPADLPIEEAALAGVSAPLVLLNDRSPAMVGVALQGSQRTLLQIRFFLPKKVGPDNEVLLRFAPAAYATFEASFLGEGFRPALVGALDTQITQSQGQTRLTALLPAIQGDLRLTWWQAEKRQPLLPKPDASQARFYARTYALFSVGTGGQELFVTVRYTLVKSPRENFLLKIPAGIQIRNVLGLGIRDYRLTLDKASGESTLDVLLTEAVTDRYELSILAETRHSSQKIDLRLPEPIGVQRESGYLAIEATGSDEIHVQTSGASAIDVQELPPEIVGGTERPILYAYRYNRRPVSWQLGLLKHPTISVPASIVDRASYTQVTNDAGEIWVSATYTIRNSFKQFMALTLPPKAQLQSAFLANRPVKPALDSKGRVLIPLKRSIRSSQDAFSVEVVFYLKSSPFRLLHKETYLLPHLDLWVSYLQWTLYLPEGHAAFDPSGLGHEWPASYARWNQVDPPAPPPRRHRSRAGLNQGYLSDQTRSSTLTPSSDPSQSAGILPVRIQLPSAGRRYDFHRYHLAPETSSSLSFSHTHTFLSTLASGLLFFRSFLLGLILALLFFFRSQTSLIGLFSILYAILFLLSFWLKTPFHYSFAAFGFVSAWLLVIAVLFLQFFQRKSPVS